MKRIMQIVLFCTLLVAFAYSQSPEELANNYYIKYTAKQWDELGQFFADSALMEFKAVFDGIFEKEDKEAVEDIMEMFMGDVTLDSIQKLSDEAFFNQMINGLYTLIGRYALMDYDSVTVIGSVFEKDDLVHVLARYRIRYNITEEHDNEVIPIEMEDIEVLSFTRINGEWKMLLSGRIKAMAQQIKGMIDF